MNDESDKLNGSWSWENPNKTTERPKTSEAVTRRKIAVTNNAVRPKHLCSSLTLLENYCV
jgi:hypothetical protein